LQYSFPVDAKGVFAVFSGSVGKYVHEFQTFYGEKAKCGVNYKDSRKYYGSANYHKDYGQYFIVTPGYLTFHNAISEHDYGLEHTADSGKFYFVSKYLKDFITGSYHDAVKFTVAYGSGDGVKASCKALC